MAKKGKTEEKYCAICEHATVIECTDACHCKLCGMVLPSGCCKKFKIDYLKIIPAVKPLPNEEYEMFKF